MDNEQNIIEKLKELPYEFSSLPLSYQENREFIKKCLENKAPILEFLSDSYKNDKEIVLLAIRTNPRSTSPLYFASEALKNDDEFAKAALMYDKGAFIHISERLKFKKNIVLYAIENNCRMVLMDTCEDVKNDREVVLKAVKLDGTDIEWASNKLQKDFEVLIESAITSGSIGLHRLKKKKLPFISETDFQQLNQKDKELYIIDYLYEIGDKSKNTGKDYYQEIYFVSQKVAMAIISCNCKKESQFKSIPDLYRNDKDVVIHAIKRNPKLFEFVGERFKTDNDVLDLVSNN